MFTKLLHQPTEIYFGQGSATALELNGLSVVFVIGESYNSQDTLKKSIEKTISKQNVNAVFIEKETGEPKSKLIDKLYHDLSTNVDCIVGIGGGSILDTAKYLAMMMVSGGSCTDYEFDDRKIIGALPIYLIPTTSGSGSEVTPYSVIQNTESGRKFTISHPCLFPRAAYIDPQLTLGLPYYQSLSTGLDASIHNLEVLLNQEGNPLITPMANVGLEIAFNYLPKLSENLDNMELRSHLSLASVMGGYGISQIRTGLIHTLSVAVAEYSNTAHGILNAHLMPYAINSNLPHFKGKLASIVSQLTDGTITSDEMAADLLYKWIDALLRSVESPGIDGEIILQNLDHLVERVLQDQGLPMVNPGPISDVIIRKIFKDIANNAF